MQIEHKITTMRTIEIEHLDPCPFCEGESFGLKSSFDTHYIWCHVCGCQGSFGLTVSKAIKLWNKPRTMKNHHLVWRSGKED